MRFPAKKHASCPKAPQDFPPNKIWHSPPPVGLRLEFPPPHLLQNLDGRTGGWGTAYVDVATNLSCIDRLPNFLTHGAPFCGLRPQRTSAIRFWLMVTSPRKVFHVSINSAGAFLRCFKKKFWANNQVLRKLSKFWWVTLLLRKFGTLQLLPSIKTQLRAVSFLLSQLFVEVKLPKKNIQDDEIINTGQPDRRGVCSVKCFTSL